MRGEAYAAKGDTDHAIADYNEAMRRNPAAAWPYELRSKIHFEKGEIDEALGDCNSAVRLEPGNAGRHNCPAIVLLKKDDADSAIRELDEVTRIAPSFVKAYRVRALAGYNEAIRLDPKSQLAWSIVASST